jgi:hypothetical protein
MQKITLFSAFFLAAALLVSCEKTPGACLLLSPEKTVYQVGEKIEVDTRCAASFSSIQYDFGTGVSEIRKTSTGELVSTSYNFTGDYIIRVTFFSKSRKKSAFEERRIVVR